MIFMIIHIIAYSSATQASVSAAFLFSIIPLYRSHFFVCINNIARLCTTPLTSWKCTYWRKWRNLQLNLPISNDAGLRREDSICPEKQHREPRHLKDDTVVKKNKVVPFPVTTTAYTLPPLKIGTIKTWSSRGSPYQSLCMVFTTQGSSNRPLEGK